MDREQASASWQSGLCPPWCTRRHDDDDEPEDRYHDSDPTHVPAILAERDHDAGPGRWSQTSGEITIVTSRHADSSDVVTFIGREDDIRQQLTLTPESAARLAEAIGHHLESLRGTD